MASCLSSMSKASVIRACAEPKEPMTTVAWRGFSDMKNGVGMSFWVCKVGGSWLDSLACDGDGASVACGATYNLDISLAIVPDVQGKRSLQTSLLVLQQDKCLVWSLRLAIVLGHQADREGILGVEGDGGLQRGLGSETESN